MTIGLAGYNAPKLLYELDHATPANYRAKVGQTLADLIANANAGGVDDAALTAAAATKVLSKAGLAIHGSTSAVVKSVNGIAYMINGVMYTLAAADLSALVGTLATAKSAAWAFYVDAAGTVTTSAKTADSASHAAATALITAPPANKAMIGFIVVDNATGSNFVGGTTPLDTGSLTVSYYDVEGSVPVGLALTATTVGALGSR